MKSMLQKITPFLFAAMLLLLAGCENTDEPGRTSEPQLLDMNAINFNINTRATGNYPDCELIQDWSLVIADDKGKIEAVLHRSDFTTTVSAPFEAETVTTQESSVSDYFDKDKEGYNIYEGPKYIYAFANMDVPAEMATKDSYISHAAAMALTLSSGGTINASTIATSGRIPMTNVIEVVLDNSPNQHINIPLIRTFAKVEFTFATLTETPVTVHQLTMNNVTLDGKSNIYMFPHTDSYGFPLFPAGKEEGHPVYDLSPYRLTVTTTQKQTHAIYVNESDIPYSETIGFTLLTQRADKETTEVRYALSVAEGLKRNDFLKIPVTLSDFEFNPRIDFYPPIGGYGQAEVTSDPGEVFFVKVTSGGQIILRPQLYDASTSTVIDDNDALLSIEITGAGSTTDAQVGSLFSEPLYYNTLDGWWTATLNGTPGRALFTLTYVVTKYGGTITLQRKIYVIVE